MNMRRPSCLALVIAALGSASFGVTQIHRQREHARVTNANHNSDDQIASIVRRELTRTDALITQLKARRELELHKAYEAEQLCQKESADHLRIPRYGLGTTTVVRYVIKEVLERFIDENIADINPTLAPDADKPRFYFEKEFRGGEHFMDKAKEFDVGGRDVRNIA